MQPPTTRTPPPSRAYRGSLLARTLASNLRPFLATYSASLSMTAWMSGGGGMMAASGAGIGPSALDLKQA